MILQILKKKWTFCWKQLKSKKENSRLSSIKHFTASWNLTVLLEWLTALSMSVVLCMHNSYTVLVFYIPNPMGNVPRVAVTNPRNQTVQVNEGSKSSFSVRLLRTLGILIHAPIPCLTITSVWWPRRVTRPRFPLRRPPNSFNAAAQVL